MKKLTKIRKCKQCGGDPSKCECWAHILDTNRRGQINGFAQERFRAEMKEELAWLDDYFGFGPNAYKGEW